jgi:hypothetical protein
MRDLVIPVPGMLSASYMVPASEYMDATGARLRARQAIEERLPGPLRTIAIAWIDAGSIAIDVLQKQSRERPVGRPDPELSTPEQREFLARACSLVQFTVTKPSTLIGIHEWMACGAATALAADLGVPLIDLQSFRFLAVNDAFAALPSAELTGPAGDLVHLGLPFAQWVHTRDCTDQGRVWVMTDGMSRFGLPEVKVDNAMPKVRDEMAALVNGVALRLWANIIEHAVRANSAPDMPSTLRIPAEMDIYRTDLDEARGMASMGDYNATIRLRFDPARDEGATDWLTVCPPSRWDLSWDDFIADTCHALFGFEKPRGYYLPEFFALHRP